MVRGPAVVLDDTPEARATMAAALGNLGFEVLEAATGEQALELAHGHAPHLIIANPLRVMDSDDFTLALSVDPEITKASVVFCGGADDARELRLLAESCEVSHILIMPCALDDLALFLAEVLGASGSLPEAPRDDP